MIFNKILNTIDNSILNEAELKIIAENTLQEDPHEPENRDDENKSLRKHIDSVQLSQLDYSRMQDTDLVTEIAFEFAQVNYPLLKRESLKPENLVDALSGEILSYPLWQGPISLDQIKAKIKQLVSIVSPKTPDELAVFYFLVFNLGHFWANSNGRIARIISAITLGIRDKDSLKRLVSKNFESRQILSELKDNKETSTSDFIQIYTKAISPDFLARIIRMLRVEV